LSRRTPSVLWNSWNASLCDGVVLGAIDGAAPVRPVLPLRTLIASMPGVVAGKSGTTGLL